MELDSVKMEKRELESVNEELETELARIKGELAAFGSFDYCRECNESRRAAQNVLLGLDPPPPVEATSREKAEQEELVSRLMRHVSHCLKCINNSLQGTRGTRGRTFASVRLLPRDGRGKRISERRQAIFTTSA